MNKQTILLKALELSPQEIELLIKVAIKLISVDSESRIEEWSIVNLIPALLAVVKQDSPPDLKEKNRGDVLNCVLGLVAQSPKVKKKSFSLSRADGSLEYGKYKFFPLVTNRIQRAQDTAVFLQIYLPKGKIEVHPQFFAVRNEGAAQQIHGEMLAGTWNGKLKVWSGLFHLDLKNIISGDHTVKVEITVSDSGPVLSKEMKLIKLSY